MLKRMRGRERLGMNGTGWREGERRQGREDGGETKHALFVGANLFAASIRFGQTSKVQDPSAHKTVVLG